MPEHRTNLRWWILAVMAIGNAINFLDRTCLGVAMPFIRKEIHLTSIEVGYALSAMLLTYAPALLLGGVLVDRFGPRKLAAGAAASWSIMTGLIGLVQGWGALILCRVLLGVLQSGATPSWAKGVSEWFPKQERGFAVSVYDNGIRVGALLSVPVMALLITHFGWRLAFASVAVIGLIWAPVWLWIYRAPRLHPLISQAELAHIEEGATAATRTADTRHMRWLDLLRYRTTWGVILVAFFTGSQVYFFLTWLPTYLISVRHFSLLREGVLGIMPLLSSALGGILGGLVGDWLVRRGRSLNYARKFCIVIGLLLAGCSSVAAWLNDDVLIIALMSIGLAANSFASVAIFALPLDVTPVASRTASLAAMQMSGTMAGGLCYPILVGYILESTHGDFSLPIIGSGIIPMIGLVVFLLLVRDVAPLPVDWNALEAGSRRRVSTARN